MPRIDPLRELGLATRGQLFCLRDPVFPLNATREAHIVFNPINIGWRPVRDLPEGEDAELIERIFVLRANTFDALQIIMAFSSDRDRFRLFSGNSSRRRSLGGFCLRDQRRLAGVILLRAFTLCVRRRGVRWLASSRRLWFWLCSR